MNRSALALLLVLAPTFAFGQAPETLKYIAQLHDPATGGYAPSVGAKPGLRATSAAIRSVKYLGGSLPSPEKTAAFVLNCHDPVSGAFAEPGGAPDVATTAVGIMAATALPIPKAKFAKALEYLRANAKTFEEVRIAAGAVEAWGVAECPFDLQPWVKIVAEFEAGPRLEFVDGGARNVGSTAAFHLRLGRELKNRAEVLATLRQGQRPDGGWGKAGANESDLETTYRVMRAFMLLKEPPANRENLRAYLARHRNPDGGSSTQPGTPSTISGVYFTTIINYWSSKFQVP